MLGWDVDAGKLGGVAALGGRVGRSLADVARACGTVVLSVFNTDQVEEVVEGLLASRPAAAGPLTLICTSTCDPDRIEMLVARLPTDRVRFVEAPVSGTSEQTARGEALGLIGGDPAAMTAARAVLDAICPRRHYLGARRQWRPRQARDQPDPRHQSRRLRRPRRGRLGQQRGDPGDPAAATSGG